MLTVKQVAARLQIGEVTVLRWLRSGKLAGVRLGGTRIGWRIPEAELDRLEQLTMTRGGGPPLGADPEQRPRVLGAAGSS